MPTDISNAVGTARQFTPRPEESYQGHYQSVNASSVAADATNSWDDLSTNLSKLNEAFQGYAVSHEKYLSATGHDAAERMINSESEDDIKRLNTIDAAQLYGYADSASNPYFKAYADKLRGGFLSTMMKNEYDSQYANTPARSMDEEAQRFSKFSQDWKEQNCSGDKAPLNQTAFDSGYNENNLINLNNLATTWTKTKNQNDIVTTMASAQSQLGKLIENSPTLLKTNGAMTSGVQTVFNNLKLMGLPASYREKLLDDFSTQLVQSGHIDATRLEQMMNNIDVTTNIDGSQQKASDLLDMQTYKTYAAQYNKQFVTKQRSDFIQQCINKKDRQAGFNLVSNARENDPDNAEAAEMDNRQIQNGIDNKIKEEKAIAAQKFKAGLRAYKTASVNAQKSNTFNGMLLAYMNGSDTYNGMPISSFSFKPEEMYPKMMETLNYYIQGDNGDEKMNYIERLMRLPQASALRQTITQNIVDSMDSIVPTSDGSPVCSDTMKSTLQFYANNPNSCEHLFGSEVANRARMLKTLTDMNGGDFDAGLQQFATYNSTDADARAGYRAQVNDLITSSNYTADGVPRLGGGSTASINVYANPDMQNEVADLATVLCCQGQSPYQALNSAGTIVQNSYYTYHNGAFPKGVLNDIGTPDDEGYFQDALDDAMASTNPDGNASNVNIRYDRDSQTFYFDDPYSGNSSYKSLAYIRQAAKEWYDRATAWAEANPQDAEDYQTTADDINNQRQDSSDEDNQYTASTGLHSFL
ncbi:hypothetical protein [Pectinatus frisingensis]|uniref:hypothetical protein n=1 Tax=Pectinatus frisingensis TaxID=865 RepID=UPI0018C76840|nr:hypothetical protein [Pectinatus frisingensis]